MQEPKQTSTQQLRQPKNGELSAVRLISTRKTLELTVDHAAQHISCLILFTALK
jgi:hypothetical protein